MDWSCGSSSRVSALFKLSPSKKKKEKSMLNFSLLFKCGNHLKFLSKTNGQTKKIYSKIELYYLLGHHNSEETM
jgi:hypothetical protein